MIRFHMKIKIIIFSIESNPFIFKSVGTFRDINIEKILIICYFVPEIKYRRAIISDEFLCVDEFPDDWFDSEFFDDFTLETF